MGRIIIRGGENISPREVEQCLHTAAGVSHAQVIGIPCPRYGEEVMAWVKLREGARVTEAELVAHCRRHLAHIKTPRHWKFVDAFPMTVTGKVQKYHMREIAIAERGGGEAAVRSTGQKQDAHVFVRWEISLR